MLASILWSERLAALSSAVSSRRQRVFDFCTSSMLMMGPTHLCLTVTVKSVTGWRAVYLNWLSEGCRFHNCCWNLRPHRAVRDLWWPLCEREISVCLLFAIMGWSMRRKVTGEARLLRNITSNVLQWPKTTRCAFLQTFHDTRRKNECSKLSVTRADTSCSPLRSIQTQKAPQADLIKLTALHSVFSLPPMMCSCAFTHHSLPCFWPFAASCDETLMKSPSQLKPTSKVQLDGSTAAVLIFAHT